jgi:hypothetical protein
MGHEGNMIYNPAMQRIINGMIRAFGAAAHEEAMRCAARFAEIEDSEGVEIWHGIASEIERRAPPRPHTGSSAPGPSDLICG